MVLTLGTYEDNATQEHANGIWYYPLVYTRTPFTAYVTDASYVVDSRTYQTRRTFTNSVWYRHQDTPDTAYLYQSSVVQTPGHTSHGLPVQIQCGIDTMTHHTRLTCTNAVWYRHLDTPDTAYLYKCSVVDTRTHQTRRDCTNAVW